MAIKVLIVDDSALIRQLLSAIVQTQPDMVVVGAAADAYAARDMVNQFAPDVITLDIEMPKMDGLTFLDKLMRARPTPVLMVSTLTREGADATLRAIELGAIDYIAKPSVGIAEGMQQYSGMILEKIRMVAAAKVKQTKTRSGTSKPQHLSYSSTEKIIAIGASTGGTEAIKEVLIDLPSNSPGIVITQHMPPGFTRTFAERLNKLCQINVKEAVNGERVLPGHAYIAPGDLHMLIERSGADYRIKLDDGERVTGHKPSVDVMFGSLARSAGANVLAVILTGMGKDGAKGMLSLFQQGAFTVAQDEASCVVFGMPGEAIKVGGVKVISPLADVAEVVVSQIKRMGSGNRL
ncbi:chemotaxis response regulator protein-glutamate methylesterase [Rheinheimera sp. UJ51]|uniref:protein-glutamate methylesterase/protein-glutamine glutaminase n=1 Tax=Rheinheimera sp. UJ51 TaxID=2892446 RepID=UPI001E4A771E|nr:chemotaxis response regulator protein-glutamate methylesterase [Rheinheimera sp. UJ51]MCC5451829.1 chemotaxis response regulator protein-glutamate methylesterase [Rheinheimera sp. UJ51]